MYYRHNDYLPNVWRNLYYMIEENYDDGSPNTAVILGIYHNVTKQQVLKDLPPNIDKVVAYQTEPLVENHWHKPDNIIRKLATYDEVWEFDYDNYLLLLKHGINAIFKPVKYTQALKRINTNVEPDIDILFYGSKTDHRNKFLQQFPGQFSVKTDDEEYMRRFINVGVVCIEGIDDNRLDEFIARSKIILNLQPHKQENGEDRQSQVRMFYPLINGKCVVSEKSKRNYFGNTILEFQDSQQFGEIVMDLLISGDWRNYPQKCSDYNRFVNREILL